MELRHSDLIIEVGSQNVAALSSGQRLSPFYRGLRLFLVFLLGFALYLLCVLPILFRNDGLFFFYGDYNVQQVPFYILAHRAIRNGEFFWNWNLDLGGTLIGDFAFYIMGSPFFWLTYPFEEQQLPYLMPVIMAIKSGVATLTSYCYIRRYLSKRNHLYALTGALLYAFSGFQACNIVFQHFHDVVAFFPLLLLCFEDVVAPYHAKEAVRYKQPAAPFVRFALVTALCAVTSYYFFYGQVIFLILYFIIRYVRVNQMRNTIYMLIRALLGGMAGVLLAAFFLLQALPGISGNSRLTNILTGYATLVYPEAKIPFDILKALVMVPDIIGKGTIFYTDTVKNSSLAVYLPLFGLAGVAAYFFQKKKRPENAQGKDYKRTLLIVCGVISLVPFFNAAFSLFNSQYYCRWFYMPILFMALMTAQVLDSSDELPLKKGALVTTVLFLFMIGVSCLPSTDAEGNIRYFNMSENPDFFQRQVIGTGIMTLFLFFIAFILPYLPFRRYITLFLTCVSVFITQFIPVYNGASLISETGFLYWKEQMLDEKVEVDTSVFSRAETDSTSSNYEMVWGVPTVHCFLSTVPSKIFDFYFGMAGLTRSVESTIPLDRKGVRAILSVRYYFENARVNTNGEFLNGEGVVGYLYSNSQNGFDIYENANYIPMGFAFDHYVTESDFDTLAKEDVDESLVKYLVLPDEIASTYGKSMVRASAEEVFDFYNENAFAAEVERRKMTACQSFVPDKDGFSATTAALKKDSLLYFSVPFLDGFQAEVDGVKTDIVKVNYGMMGIPVEAGEHAIRVTYHPPHFKTGCMISCMTLCLLVLYMLTDRLRMKKERKDIEWQA